MPTHNNNQKNEELYWYYHRHIRPLLAALEIETSREYVELQNEIRAAFDHIARTYINISDDDIEHNHRCALGHLQRVELDILKHLNICFHTKSNKFFTSVSKYDLSRINNGAFLNYIRKAPHLVYLFEKQARTLESKSKHEALVAYRSAYVIGTDFFGTIEKHRKDIRKAKRSYLLGVLFKWLLLFFTTFIIYEFQAIARYFCL